MFAFDVEPLFEGGKKKVVTLSFDDGVVQDVRFIKLLDKYGIKCTFNLSSGILSNKENFNKQNKRHKKLPIEDINEIYKNHEIASHAYRHMSLTDINSDRIMFELVKDREKLEEISGRIVRGFAYPYGTYDDKVVECLKNNGIVYARTVESSYNFEIPKDFLRWKPTIYQIDDKLMEITEEFLNYDYRGNDNKVALLYVWGHSYEFDTDEKWNRIEQFLKLISKKDDIWYATNIEIVDYINAYKSLIFSIDGKKVYNPTAQTIWIRTDYDEENCNAVEIKSGETKLLKYDSKM